MPFLSHHGNAGADMSHSAEPGSPTAVHEDPAPLHAELKRREAQLGPSHPAVAEAASTLAILYNQVQFASRNLRIVAKGQRRGTATLPVPVTFLPDAVLEFLKAHPHPLNSILAITCISSMVILSRRDDNGAQAGDFVAAQPLYECALGIWEVTLGPEHPDVAHTLTDLAVLHLEQVLSCRLWDQM